MLSLTLYLEKQKKPAIQPKALSPQQCPYQN